jgi:hypothetical protein
MALQQVAKKHSRNVKESKRDRYLASLDSRVVRDVTIHLHPVPNLSLRSKHVVLPTLSFQREQPRQAVRDCSVPNENGLNTVDAFGVH